MLLSSNKTLSRTKNLDIRFLGLIGILREMIVLSYSLETADFLPKESLDLWSKMWECGTIREAGRRSKNGDITRLTPGALPQRLGITLSLHTLDSLKVISKNSILQVLFHNLVPLLWLLLKILISLASPVWLSVLLQLNMIKKECNVSLIRYKSFL